MCIFILVYVKSAFVSIATYTCKVQVNCLNYKYVKMVTSYLLAFISMKSDVVLHFHVHSVDQNLSVIHILLEENIFHAENCS